MVVMQSLSLVFRSLKFSLAFFLCVFVFYICVFSCVAAITDSNMRMALHGNVYFSLLRLSVGSFVINFCVRVCVYCTVT